jgi:hypothetical protein
MSPPYPSCFPGAVVLICCLWGVIALATGAEKDVSQDLASTEDPLLPQRLYETNNCPIATKPTCDDRNARASSTW